MSTKGWEICPTGLFGGPFPSGPVAYLEYVGAADSEMAIIAIDACLLSTKFQPQDQGLT